MAYSVWIYRVISSLDGGKKKKKTLNISGWCYIACGHVRWLRDSPVQETAVLWVLSRSACVLIQEGYMVVLDVLQDTVGC